jgi:hypothetical protein
VTFTETDCVAGEMYCGRRFFEVDVEAPPASILIVTVAAARPPPIGEVVGIAELLPLFVHPVTNSAAMASGAMMLRIMYILYGKKRGGGAGSLPTGATSVGTMLE